MTHTDMVAFESALDELRRELKAASGPEDLRHFRRISISVRVLGLIGLGVASTGVNPFSILALALASFVRWAIVAHHVSHKGYDELGVGIPGLQSKHFARGWRRVLDWMDWMEPAAWHYEHDVLHHYRLGEEADPDLAERNASFLRNSPLPMWLRPLVVVLGSLIWKPLYYAPSTLCKLLNKEEGRDDLTVFSAETWIPWKPRFRRLLLRSYLPYISWRFILLPALFLPLGPSAAQAVLVNLLLAELLSNFWSFWVIVPNHTGADLYRFEERAANRGEHYLRQVIGSVDYHCGNPIGDLLQGWLNYQIEHHLFPSLNLRRLQQSHPRVKEICARYGVPFIQESMAKRMVRTMWVLIGKESNRRVDVGL